MRYISNMARYKIILRPALEAPDPSRMGRMRVVEPGLYAQFNEHDVTDWEREMALKHFKFPGMPVQEDTLEPIDPSYRLATFDTTMQGWDEETRKFAEERLETAIGANIDYIKVEKPKLDAPWPGYDKLVSAKKIAELVESTGSDIEAVVAYERENKNRADVIEAVQALAPAPDPDEVVVSA